MKKYIFLTFLMLVFTGCIAESESITFVGESDNWQGIYTVASHNYESKSESRKYTFIFKEASNDIDNGKLMITFPDISHEIFQ